MSDSDLLPNKDFRIQVAGMDDRGIELFSLLASTSNIPGVSVGEVPTSYRNRSGFVPGNKLEYPSLSIRFDIDENLESYRAINDWIVHNGHERDVKYHDIIITIVDSTLRPTLSFRYVSAFPTTLDGFEVNNRNSSIEFAQTGATFRYDYYTIE